MGRKNWYKAGGKAVLQGRKLNLPCLITFFSCHNMITRQRLRFNYQNILYQTEFWRSIGVALKIGSQSLLLYHILFIKDCQESCIATHLHMSNAGDFNSPHPIITAPAFLPIFQNDIAVVIEWASCNKRKMFHWIWFSLCSFAIRT